jgi:AAA+ superfamily predicted ATPase
MNEELRTQVQLVRALLEVRIAGSELTSRSVELDDAMARVVRLRALLPACSTASAFLREAFDLTPTELDALWHLTAFALDDSTRSLMTEFTGELACTTEALRRCIHGADFTIAALKELGNESRLLSAGLVEQTVNDNRRSWVVSARVLAWLIGDRCLHPALAPLATFGEAAPLPSSLEVDETSRQSLTDAVAAQASLIVIAGSEGAGRCSLVRLTCAQAGIKLLELDAGKVSPVQAEMDQQLCIVARECKLLGRAVLIRNVDQVTPSYRDTMVSALATHLVDVLPGHVFVTCAVKRVPFRCNRPCIVVELKPVSTSQRATLWLRELGQGTQEDAEYLATQYPLAPALIHHAAKAAKARASGRNLEPEDIYTGIRAVLDDKLGDYARRVDITQTWDDVVLPEDQMEQINYLIARIRQRRTVYEQWGFAAKVGKGLGTSALFSGPPGTGKTMICALIAKELGIELYQVDMAKITSKYIGETERNLAALFDAAEAGHAILLFDEADSLFGKRTDVKSSNDRYANLETNYLLQRLESFTGICLLTSNHESNIDPAFQRRLSLHVRFELPEAEERAALWKAMLPAAAPVEQGVDFAALAKRFAMSGGYIRNAALRAAFAAADEGSVITGEHLARAAKAEYEGMGKIAVGN